MKIRPQTDMTKLTVASRSFAKAPQKLKLMLLPICLLPAPAFTDFSDGPCALKGAATLRYKTEDARRNKGGADLQVTYWSVSHLPQMDETALHSWLYQKWDNTNKTRVCGKAANDLLKDSAVNT
jgi:hypothetical protein